MRKALLLGTAAAITLSAIAWQAWYGYHHPDRHPLTLLASAANFASARPVRSHDGAGPLITANDAALLDEPIELLSMPKLEGEEESDSAEVIDLTQLQKTPPRPDDCDELPAGLPKALDVPILAKRMPGGPPPVVVEFLPHSADANEVRRAPMAQPAGQLWKRIMQLVTGSGDEPPVFVPIPMPVPPRMPSYHQQHPSCPYTGGCPYDGALYRQSAKVAPAKPDGEEAQDAPKPNRKSLDVRLGYIPWSWLARPF